MGETNTKAKAANMAAGIAGAIWLTAACQRIDEQQTDKPRKL
jgi:hypothetical protein